MLKSAYDKGIFFWDTADAYGTHDAIKAALKTVPREKVTILTKTDAWTADKTKEDIDRFLKELGTDYIDILLLHTRMSPDLGSGGQRFHGRHGRGQTEKNPPLRGHQLSLG